jgi:hypothetical protein
MNVTQRLLITCGGGSLEVESLNTPTAAAILAVLPFRARAAVGDGDPVTVVLSEGWADG